MDDKLLATLIGVVSGAIGYWLSTFSIQPILRYKNIRNKVHRDFIYFAQVVNAEKLNDDMQKLYGERVLANRDSSASLSAAFLELPWWYRNCLTNKGLSPEGAARNLIGFSNTTNHSESYALEQKIRQQLGLPQES